jgi:hypothetical protein
MNPRDRYPLDPDEVRGAIEVLELLIPAMTRRKGREPIVSGYGPQPASLNCSGDEINLYTRKRGGFKMLN